MKSIIINTVIVLVFSITVFSCKKAGPQGLTGAAGAQGPIGNANVISTIYMDTLTSWTLTGSGKVYQSEYVPVPALDSTVFVSGAVLSYMSMGGGVFYTLNFSNGDFSVDAEYGLGYCKFYFFKNDLSTPPDPTGLMVRIVVIPPAAKRLHPGVNYNNYQEVKRVFQLKE